MTTNSQHLIISLRSYWIVLDNVLAYLQLMSNFRHFLHSEGFHYCYLSHSYSILHGTDHKTSFSLSMCPSVSTLMLAFLDECSLKLAKT